MAISLDNELIDGKLTIHGGSKLYAEQDNGSGRMRIIIVCAAILLLAGLVGAGFLYHEDAVAKSLFQNEFQNELGPGTPKTPHSAPRTLLAAADAAADDAADEKIVIRQKKVKDDVTGKEGVVITSKARFGAPAKPSVLELNTATIDQLKTLKGIGPVLAEKIVANRPYASVDELIKVKGIGEKTLAKLKPFLKVEN